jgi:hypothetical protein
MKFLLSLLLVVGCSAIKKQGDDYTMVVGTYHEGSGDLKDSYLASLKKDFPDGTKIEKSEFRIEKNEIYLYREGHTAKRDCVISRTPVDSVDGFLVVNMRAQGTETCSGNGCDTCAFKDSGGCTCKTSTNTCNHTITRNRLLYW